MNEHGIYDLSTFPIHGFEADLIEKLLGIFDSKFSEVASRTIDLMKDPSKKDALDFTICAFHQLLRSSVSREYLNQNNKTILRDNPKAKGIVDNFGARILAVAIQFFPAFIDNIKLTLWKTSGPIFFHSSDNPMSMWCLIKGEMHHAITREIVRADFEHRFYYYPLSPNYFLEMYPRVAGHGQSFEVFSASPDAVNMYNQYIEQAAQKFIILPPKK